MERLDMFRIHEMPSLLCVWSTGKYTLNIIYDVNESRLSSNFPPLCKQNLKDYIDKNLEEAFISAIDKIGDGYYQLNIASTIHFHGEAGDDFKLKMLNVFLPIIQKFMVDALTDNLYVVEDGKLVKQ